MTQPAPIIRRASPSPSPSRVVRAALVAVVTALSGVALAHATIVFGTLTTDPAPPPTGTPVTIELSMVDPVDAPVEDAVVMVEAAPPDGGETIVTDAFRESAPGVYRQELVFAQEGRWTLLLRDRTFRQEEARATVEWLVGADGDAEPVSFLFPPTATGPQRLTTWLIWLIGLPLVVGAIVTVMVLRSSAPAPEAASDDGPEHDAQP